MDPLGKTKRWNINRFIDHRHIINSFCGKIDHIFVLDLIFWQVSLNEVCFSCRAFFRRLVRKSKLPDKSSCNKLSIEGVGHCPMKGKTRQLCRFCRYQKCISVGILRILMIANNFCLLKIKTF